MLRKLLKYDLRANMKIYCFLWPCIVVAAILQRLLVPVDMPSELESFLLPLFGILLVFSIFCATIISMVICVNRFYKGLLGDEGYLMFTLPVQPWQLILSKLLVAMLTIGVTAILSFVSMFLLVGGIMNEVGMEDLLPEAWDSLTQMTNGKLPLVIVNLILSQALSILHIYLACAVGHLAKKHRVMASVGAYFGINYGQQFLTALFSTFTELNSLWFSTLSSVIFVALFFYLTHLILQKRLNLE